MYKANEVGKRAENIAILVQDYSLKIYYIMPCCGLIYIICSIGIIIIIIIILKWQP